MSVTGPPKISTLQSLSSASSRTPLYRKSLGKAIRSGSPATVSRTPCAVSFVNDDEEERRQRRLETHVRSVMSPRIHPQNSSRGGLSSLSNVQIAEHYADCIKLSSENKINSRNAFGLHLIDYMLEVLLERGELENFQVAGCTLDAGAKIYASRVDSIYSDAYKILGGIGKGDTHEQGQPVIPQLLKERSKGESTSTIEGNLKVLDLCNKDLQLEMDPILKHMSEEGLMLWQLHTREDYSLVLDMQCDCTDVDPLFSDEELHFSCGGLNSVTNSADEICHPFSTFFMTKEHSVTNFIEETDASPCYYGVEMTHPLPDYSMVPFPTNFSESDCDDDMSGPFSQDVPTEESDDIENPPDVVLGSKNAAYSLDVQENPSADCHLITKTQLQSDYSYLGASIFSTWAGLSHWKFRTHSSNEERVERRAPTKHKSAQRVCFHEMCDEQLFEMCKVTTPMFDSTSSCTSLPQDVHLRMNVLLDLFLHSGWKVERMKPLVVEDELHDSVCGYGESSVYDFHSESSLTACDTHFCEHLDMEETTVDTLALVEQPKKVQKVSIEYSKTSKKIDAKKLKGTMWQVLCADSVPTAFSRMYCEVCERIPENMKTEISAAICFVFLLHLANEKGFGVFEGDNLCDVTIKLPAA